MSQEHGNGGRYPGSADGQAGDGPFGAQQQGWQPPHGGAQQAGHPQSGSNQPHPTPPHDAAQQPYAQQPPPGWQPPQAPYGSGPGGPAAPGQGGPGYGGAGGTEDGPKKSNKAVWIVSGIALVIIAALVTVLLLILGDDDEDEDDPTATEEPTDSEEVTEPEEEEGDEDTADEQEDEGGLEDDDEGLGLTDEDEDPLHEDEDTGAAEEIADINQALTQAQIEELLLEESDMPGDVATYQLNPSDEWFRHWVSLWPTEQDTVGMRSEADASGDPDVEDFATCIELSVPLSDMDTANTAAADFDAFYGEGGANYVNLGIVAPDATPDTDALWDEAADHCDVTLDDRAAEFGFFDIDGVRGVGFREPGDDLWYSVELSMDMGENLLWVHAMEVTSEQLEEIVGAQAAKLEQYN